MTARSYPDLSVTSARGTVRFSATSDANLEPGARYQSGFAYALEDIQAGRLVWRREQTRGEGSPVEAFVSDYGDVVLRTHFLDWTTEHLLLIDRTGAKRLDVVISADATARSGPVDIKHRTALRRRSRLGYQDVPTMFWHDPHVRPSTAGPMWTVGALVTFPEGPSTLLFSLRTAWGRRIIIDVISAEAVPDELQTAAIRTIVEAEERRRALDVLRQSVTAPASTRGVHLGAIIIAMEQRLAGAVPLLRAHEKWPVFVGGTRSYVLGSDWFYQPALIRSLARLALRRLDAEPDGGGNYLFAQSVSTTSKPAVVELRAPAHAWELAATLPLRTDAQAALRALGAPDHIDQFKRRVDRFYAWSETWDYDGPIGSTRLTWSLPASAGKDEARKLRHLVAVDAVEGWRSAERLLSILFPF